MTRSDGNGSAKRVSGGRAHALLAAAFLLAGFLAGARAEEEAVGGVETEAAGTELFDPEPEVGLPLDEPVEMIEAEPERHRMLLRTSLWLPYSTSEFRYGAGATEFSLEDDFGSSQVKVLLPLEGYIRTESQEFRLRYVWWTSKGSKTLGGADTLDFGSESFTAEKVTAALATQSLGLDFVQRILESNLLDLYIAAGADILHTSLELSAASGSDTLTETIPILTVGLGLRFKIREDLSVSITNSALSYSQLLGLKEEFFGMNDVYRNFELSLLWDKAEKLDLGVSWRWYRVDVISTEDPMEANQEMNGLSCWARFKF